MGSGSSTPAIETPANAGLMAPAANLSQYASVSLEQAQKAASEAQAQAQSMIESASQQAAQATASAQAASTTAWYFKMLSYFLGFAALAFGLLMLYDWLAIKFGWPAIPWLTQVVTKIQQDLSITKAMHGNTDVTANVVNMVSNGSLTIPASISKTLSSSVSGLKEGDQFTIVYQYSGDVPYTVTVDDSTDVTITPTTKPGTPSSGSGQQKATTPPKSGVSSGVPFITRLFNAVSGGDSSGDLVSRLHDATGSGSIAATNAPLSNETQGAYSMQWWMFIKDWNYGYGKQKSVIKRGDPTSTAVTNPMISLHPTDNTLQVTISLFGSDGSTPASTPAPATGSGASTEDVYVCEVTDVPLQTWFSVGVSVFGRNLDVYIDGKLVKSCFLPGVPKPAAGDIQLTSGGGFSGYLCNFYHYARMLTPGDAMTFFSSGTSCQNASPTTSSSTASATGYSVKFGVYDTLGKQVQEYTF